MPKSMDKLLAFLFVIYVIGIFGGTYSTSFLVERFLHRTLPSFVRGLYTLIVGFLLYFAIAYAFFTYVDWSGVEI